jgi:hypothetical protein
LASKGNIRERIAEIQAKGADHAVLSRAALLDRLLELSLAAEAAGHWSSAIRATEILGRELHGMFRDRPVVEQGPPLHDVPEHELRRRLVDALVAGGVSRPSALAFAKLPADPDPGGQISADDPSQ